MPSNTTGTNFIQEVAKADTTTGVVGTPSPSAVGQQVTFTATVSPVAPATGTPIGTVQFFDGTNPISGQVPLVQGSGSSTASFQISSLSFGQHNIRARYSGDANTYNFSEGTTTHVVTANTTTNLQLAGGTNPSVYGQALTYRAFVTAPPGQGTPTAPWTSSTAPT